jgi:hypothetical protein
MNEPTFLLIAWPAPDPEGSGTGEVEAFLCRHHRNEIAAMFPTARGRRGLGESCDFCEGSGPRVAVPVTAWPQRPRGCASLSRATRSGLTQGPAS